MANNTILQSLIKVTVALKEYVDNKVGAIFVPTKLSQLEDDKNYATANNIPTKVSQLNNDSGYLTSVPSEYVTETELSAKGYLTSVPSEYVTSSSLSTTLGSYVTTTALNNKGYLTSSSLSEYAKRTELHSHTNKTTLDGITSTNVSNWSSAYTHSTSAHAPSNAQKNSDITKAEIETKLTGDIATHTHSQYLTSHQDLSAYAKNADIPTKTSQLTNDSNYATQTYVGQQITALVDSAPEAMNTLGELATAINAHGDIYEAYVEEMSTALAGKSDTGHNHDDKYYTETEIDTKLGSYAKKTDIPSVPTKTSQLTNDSGYLTSIPTEYVTETELTNKGYLTSTGTIDKATNATKATQDSEGQQINTTYIKGLSVSGKTVTYTKGDGTTGTITTQDTTYSANTGIKLNGTTFQHTNSVTAGTAQGDASKTLTWGGTFAVPTVSYDAQGHITGKGTTTMTMPSNPAKNPLCISLTFDDNGMPTASSHTGTQIVSALKEGRGILVENSQCSATAFIESDAVTLTVHSIDVNGNVQQNLIIVIDSTGAVSNSYYQGIYNCEYIDSLEDIIDAKADKNHAVSSTDYGVATDLVYGHVMATSTTPKANGTASVGTEKALFARGDHVHPAQTSVSGNAGTATKLATARNITIGNKTNSFDGSDNITFTLSDIGIVQITQADYDALTTKDSNTLYLIVG